MQINTLQRTHPNMKRMIVARGGKRGKTAGRGGKGQSARAGNKRRPEWRDIIKKLPKLRGRGVNQNKPITEAAFPINLALIETVFSANDSITPTTLAEKGLISTWSGSLPTVKILGDGDVTKAFKIAGCYVSQGAKTKIEKAGGSITEIKPVTTQKVKVATKPAAPKVEKKPVETKKAEPKPVKETVAKTEKAAKSAKKAVK